MIILISGASHTGKTLLAQKLLEKYKYPYLSIDHLKMGLIRSGNTTLTPLSDDSLLTEYLWPIVCEMIKTAIENRQNLIVEGCYIPFDWAKDFEKEYLENIKFCCLVMSEKYIEKYFDEIKRNASVIENRGADEGCTLETVLKDNAQMLEQCLRHSAKYVLIDEAYKVDMKIIDSKRFTSKYAVRRLTQADVELIYDLCSGNPQFYKFSWNRTPLSTESIKEDFKATPPGKSLSDKYYVGFFDGDKLVTVLDLIDGYPEDDIAYVGLFIMAKEYQGKGIGSALVTELCDYLKSVGFKKVRLGIDKENPQSNHFWKKNGFTVLKEVPRDGSVILVAERDLY